MFEVPNLDTERLSLRGHSLEDFPDSAAMWADARVTRYIGGKPFSNSEVWSRLLRHRGHWSLLGFGYWVLRERVTNRFVGEVGYFDLRRDIEPRFDGTPEIGWALAHWAQGQGLATEAVRAVVAWGDRNLKAARTVCAIEPANLPSIRVATKCGYVQTHRSTFKGEPVLLFSRQVERSGA
ncbi:MAG: GNAT family N-acetyltransferase [Planctomycetota bacterium]